MHGLVCPSFLLRPLAGLSVWRATSPAKPVRRSADRGTGRMRVYRTRQLLASLCGTGCGRALPDGVFLTHEAVSLRVLSDTRSGMSENARKASVGAASAAAQTGNRKFLPFAAPLYPKRSETLGRGAPIEDDRDHLHPAGYGQTICSDPVRFQRHMRNESARPVTKRGGGGNQVAENAG